MNRSTHQISVAFETNSIGRLRSVAPKHAALGQCSVEVGEAAWDVGFVLTTSHHAEQEQEDDQNQQQQDHCKHTHDRYYL